MQPICAKDLLAGLKAAAPLADTPISLVTTDSRKIVPGCVFVAFPGAKFDGHDFAASAVAQGAAYVVCNHPVDGVPADKLLLCEDSYRAMMIIGANYRARFSPKMIAVTGSVGKTTTKEFVAAVLSAFGETVKTEGNQNNELGMPNTLLRFADTTRYAAIEMGMSDLGEISRLSQAAKPDAAIITCIGVSHMETLGSRENIRTAKLEVCDGLPAGAPLVLNRDDDMLRAAALPAHVTPVWYSLKDQTADVYASHIVQQGAQTAFVIEDADCGSFPVTIPAVGRHNVSNALAAYCAATRLGLDARTAARALADFAQTGMRQHVVECGGITVIEDCYNANPDSMKAALAMFQDWPCKRRFALLGDMLELGDISEAAHADLGRLAAESGLYCLITYGDAAERTAITAAAKGQKTIYAHNYRQAADALLNRVAPGDAVLVKASRSIALENALAIFYAEWPEKNK